MNPTTDSEILTVETASSAELLLEQQRKILAACVGVYLSAFSKWPFDEPWGVDGKEISGLMLNPRSAGYLVATLSNQTTTRTKIGEGEEIQVSSTVLRDHINNFLHDPMTGFLITNGWITTDEYQEMRLLGDELQDHGDERQVTLEIPYPLTAVIDIYTEAINDPLSLVLLGYQEGDPFDPESSVSYSRITPETFIPYSIAPRMVARIVTMNHPESMSRVNTIEKILDETKHYLSEEDEMILIEALGEEKYPYLAYLGEIAKIPDTAPINATGIAGLQYIQMLMEQEEKALPEQLVYLTMSGTTVAETSGGENPQSRLSRNINRMLRETGIQYKEKMLKFNKVTGGVVIIGILQKV